MCEVNIDASSWYQSWTFVAYQLLELRDDKLSLHGVTPFYLTMITIWLWLTPLWHNRHELFVTRNKNVCSSVETFFVGLEAPTTDVNVSQLTLVLTSHHGGNHTLLQTVFCQKIVAGMTASACELKDYHRKQEEIHVICVTSQLSLTSKLLNWHYRCFHDCNYEEFLKTKQIF